MFYDSGESPPKKSRSQDYDQNIENNTSSSTTNQAATTTFDSVTHPTIRPPFRTLRNNLSEFTSLVSQPIPTVEQKGPALKDTLEPKQLDGADEPTRERDNESPIPLKNLGNTCYENSIIQCLFNLNTFMTNFDGSMAELQHRIHGSHKPQNDADGIGSSVSTSAHSSESHDSKDFTNEDPMIDQNDVRYRIANAFVNLYKSYMKKRCSVSTNKNNQMPRSSPSRQLISTSNIESSTKSDFAITHSSSAAIPVFKSADQAQSTEHQVDDANASVAPADPVPASSGPIETKDEPNVSIESAPSLSPIALVSSTASVTSNEQSEIESRLEDLKSAVGEKSSQFNSAHQQDASEFFYHVIDSILEFYQSLNMTSDDDNPVIKAFELELDYLIKCPKCRYKHMTEPEKIRTLPLALPHVNNDSHTNSDEYQPQADGAPTPPTSDIGLDSPGSAESENQHRTNNGSETKGLEALMDNNDEIIQPIDHYSNNTMSIAKLDLTDKMDHQSNEEPKSITPPAHNSSTPAPQTLSSSPNQDKHYTLRDALNNYFKDDLLDYGCSQSGCDSKQRTKKCLIRKLPQILFITLARYSYTGKKNLDEIEAPFELSVPFRENKSPSHSPSTHRSSIHDGDDTYQLVAVVCHLGSSLNAGHYTSYVYNQNNSSWYSCDDDSITKVSEADVRSDVSKTGYCFFYAHKSSLEQGMPSTASSQAAEATVEQEIKEHNTIQPTEKIFTCESRAMNAINCVAKSTVVLTPESSPKSSPSPTRKLETLHDSHMLCAMGVDDDADDWA